MWLPLVSIIIGFIGLTWSADKFVSGASACASNLGVSPLMIGLTIVAFGTSAPEILVSADAALTGVPAIAIGNALGSNIINIGLVLGITLIICPITLPKSLLRRELPILLLVTAVAFFVLYDLYLNQVDAIILLALLLFISYWLVRSKVEESSTHQKEPSAHDEEPSAHNEEPSAHNEELLDIPQLSNYGAAACMASGLVILLLSSSLLVWAASSIASALGISELVIGLTVVALGTSLPELATSITSALKGHDDLALGNIVGSNILNLLAVLPLPGLISPSTIEESVLWRDCGTMLLLTLVVSFFCYGSYSSYSKGGANRVGEIGRVTGFVLLFIYLTYSILLFLQQSS